MAYGNGSKLAKAGRSTGSIDATETPAPMAKAAHEDYEVNEIIRDDAETKRLWGTAGDGTVFWASTDVTPKVPSGLYRCSYSDQHGYMLIKMLIHTDGLLLMESKTKNQVFNEITYFWSDEIKARYDERKFLYKRGILMYGDPGSGKTACIQMLIQEIIKRDGIALYGDNPSYIVGCLQMIRRIEPKRGVVVVMEDFETLTDRSDRENEWLAMLDGEAQVDNVVFLATTNYIEKLDKRFTDRPSRFDVVVSVPMPSATIRATYLRLKETGMELAEIKRWVNQTKGFSIAHLKELIISVKVLGKSFDHEVERLREMMKRSFSNAEFDMTENGDRKGVVGFAPFVPEPASDEQVDWIEFEKSNWK